MTTQDGQESATGDSGLRAAADRLRDSAKWLIASFGAAAAVVLVGVSISDLERLSGDTPGYRLAIAIGGAVAGIVGTLGALSLFHSDLAGHGGVAVPCFGSWT